MSLITRCTACGTMFKVVPDQLRISQGWVRCGHCTEVFDATTSLQDEHASPVKFGPTAPQSNDTLASPSAGAPAFSPVEALLVQPPAAAARAIEVVVPPVAASMDVSAAPAPAEPARPRGIGPMGAESRSFPFPVSVPAPLSVPAGDTDDHVESRELDDVSFVREARRKAFWKRPAVRALLGLVALLLAGVLGLQYLVHERDRLAAMEPGLKPLLDALCRPLQCRVDAPRQIESIAIDSSTFNKLRGDAYRLSFSLKNQSTMEVAMPAIELTLTDMQDQAVIRRVLEPRDMGAASSVIAPASEWQASLALSLTPGANTPRVAGYRLLAFYP